MLDLWEVEYWNGEVKEVLWDWVEWVLERVCEISWGIVENWWGWLK